jgi:hydrogenase maturation protease
MHFMRNALRDDRMGMRDPILLIGVGNEFRSDDGLGIYAAREIRRRNVPGVRVVEQNGDGTALMEAWEDYRYVIVVDAMNSGTASGDVHCIDAVTQRIPSHLFHYSSHSFGVVEAIEMSRVLKRLPEMLLLYGIEGKLFEVGPGLTDSVLKNMPEMLSNIEHDLHRIHSQMMEA